MQRNPTLFRSLSGLTSLLLIACLALTSQIARADSERFIDVSASGELEAMPDNLKLHLQLVTEAPSLQEAKASMDKAFNRFLKVTQDIRLPSKQIDAAQIRNYPQYQWKDGERRYLGEQVSRSVTITLNDLERHTDLVDLLMQIESVRIQHTELGFANPELLQHQALKLALLNARRKAELMANTLEVKLGEVLRIQEGSGQQFQPLLERSMMVKADSPNAAAPMIINKQTVRAQVSLRFGID